MLHRLSHEYRSLKASALQALTSAHTIRAAGHPLTAKLYLEEGMNTLREALSLGEVIGTVTDTHKAKALHRGNYDVMILDQGEGDEYDNTIW